MTTTNTNTTTNTDPSTTVTVSSPVTWFEVHTADVARAKEFYATVFGWTFDDAMADYTMIQLGEDAPIGGGLVDTGGASPNDAIFMIQVPDVAAAIDAARAAGGSAITEVQSVPAGITFGYVANPDGAVFGIWCPPG